MRYALISDIHGNLEALEAVLEEIDKMTVDELLCLGDIIGYGPDPEECVARVKERSKVILAGNHDYAPLGLVDTSYFNPYAKSAVEWTSAQITPETREFLKKRPLTFEADSFLIVHATPAEPAAWDYILSIDDAAENFPTFSKRCCFIGHSHVPVVISQSEDQHIRVFRVNHVTLEEKKKYIINIGSVGQPRDLDPRAAFATFDSATGEYILHRVGYDVKTTQEKIISRGLPSFLAERLALGQ